MSKPKYQTESFVKQKNRQERRKEMIRKAKLFFAEERKELIPVDNGKAGSMKGDRCRSIDGTAGGCGQFSMIRYYTADKLHVVRACIRRFDTRKDSGCGYTDKVPVDYDRFKKKKDDAPKENAASSAV